MSATDAELQAVLDGLGAGVSYDLLDRDGPPLLPAGPGACWWCGGPSHAGPLVGSSCPLRVVPTEALSPGARWLRERLL